MPQSLILETNDYKITNHLTGLKNLYYVFGLISGGKIELKLAIEIKSNNVNGLKKQWIFENNPFDKKPRTSAKLDIYPEIRDWNGEKKISIIFRAKRALALPGYYSISIGYMDQYKPFLDEPIFTGEIIHIDTIKQKAGLLVGGAILTLFSDLIIYLTSGNNLIGIIIELFKKIFSIEK